ncbi:TIR domain-containing protein [bacterium]|nr:TIR domain-containing protein [bacterium]
MAKLDSKIIQKIVNMLTPLMREDSKRVSLLYLAFGSSAVVDRINLGGAPEDFVTNLVKTLVDYGKIEPNKQALWALLEIVRKRVGLDQQNEIDTLSSIFNPPSEDEPEPTPTFPKPQAAEHAVTAASPALSGIDRIPVQESGQKHEIAKLEEKKTEKIRPETKPKRVFISYSHDSHSHVELIRELSDRLRKHGVNAWIDQYEPSPEEGWPIWMLDQIKRADYVLVICTENYKLRFEGDENTGIGRGVKWEGAIITQQIYESEIKNQKFIPVVFTSQGAQNIPVILKPWTYYSVLDRNKIDDVGYEALYRLITNQVTGRIPPIGKVKDLARDDLRIVHSQPLPKAKRKLDFLLPTTIEEYLKSMRPVPPNTPRFHMASFLVSNELFYNFVCANEQWSPGLHADPYLKHWQAGKPQGEHRRFPITHVSCEAAAAFAGWLSALSNMHLRLPYVHEWELAARASRVDWFEEEVFANRVVYFDTSNRLRAIDAVDPNPLGIHDLLGNAYDMCLPPDKASDRITLAGGCYHSWIDDLQKNLIVISEKIVRNDTSFRLVQESQ